mgnify:CR=1 FL=1
MLLSDIGLVLGNIIDPVRDRDPNGVKTVVGHSLEVIFGNPGIPMFLEHLEEIV